MGSGKAKPHSNIDLNSSVVKTLYETYAQKLFAYTCKNYGINEDDAWTIVYKTIYKLAEVNDKYVFENKHKQAGFVFKTHINFLRNYFRDNKSFESINSEVKLSEDVISTKEELPVEESIQIKILKNELDKLEEWERILLLMRGQNMPYGEISKYVDKPERQLKVYYARLKKQMTEKINEQLNNLKNV